MRIGNDRIGFDIVYSPAGPPWLFALIILALAGCIWYRIITHVFFGGC